MIDTKLLRQKILDLAIRGKLVPQDPNDEPASELLKRIKAEKEALIKAGKMKRDKHESFIFRGEDKRYYEQIGGKTNDITDEIPFSIPQSWEWVRFGFITINRDGERIPLSKQTRSSLEKKYDYYGASGIIDKVGDYLFSERLLLVGEDGANLITRSKPIAFIADGFYWVNNHAHVLQNTSAVILDFLTYYINSISLDAYITGTAQPKMTQDNMNKIPVPLPPLAEQKRIVVQIDNLLKCVDEINIESETLKKSISLTKQKILDLAIRGKLVPQDTNDEPASELLRKIKAEKEALINAGKLKRDKHESFIFKGDDNCYYEQIDGKRVDITEDIPFDIPKSWCWCRLGSFANIIMGQSPDGSSVNNNGSGIEFHQGKIYFGERFLHLSTQRTIAPTRIVPEKSVLICVRAPVGIVNITNREICIGRGLAAAIPFRTISESFLAYWIVARKSTLIEGATGSTFLAVSVDQVKGLLIPIPPLMEQQRIAEKIAEINLALEVTLE